MTDKIEVEKINNVHMRVIADPGTLQEVSEFFSFRPNGYQFSPKYKAKVWDGYVRLITPFKPLLYIGLLDHLKQFCETREYELVLGSDFDEEPNVPDDFGHQIVEDIGGKFPLRDYQNDYIVNAIRKKRSLSLSPTSCLDPNTELELELDEDSLKFLEQLRK